MAEYAAACCCTEPDDDGPDGPIIDWDGLADGFIAHLELADHRNLSFKASKTVFGAPEMEFYGRVCHGAGVRHGSWQTPKWSS